MITVRQLGLVEYLDVWQAMQAYTNARDHTSTDQIWLVQHPPVFTQGQRSRPEHILHADTIPVVHSDRGGQVTYHGPGQLIAYVLLELKRYSLSIRGLVSCLEQAVIAVLAAYGIDASAQCQAPGVYVQDAKICSLGLRVRRGYSYHGLSLNVDMDLTPFRYIHPCGNAHLRMTQLADWVPGIPLMDVQDQLTQALLQRLQACQNANTPRPQ